MRTYNVCVARFPGSGTERHEVGSYLFGLSNKMRKDETIGDIAMWTKGDTPITMTRNECVRECLDKGIDYLLMIDSDMVPDITRTKEREGFWESSWKFMMERRRHEDVMLKYAEQPGDIPRPATVGAPYCGPPPHEEVYVFTWQCPLNDHPDPAWRLKMIHRDLAAQMQGIQEVAALPTGLILYDMRVFGRPDSPDGLRPPWFKYEWEDEYESKKASTEDVYQTRNASLLGFPQFCNWDCWAGHRKEKTVGKPFPLTVEHVQKQMLEAAQAMRRRDERIVHVGDPPAVSLPVRFS